MSLCEVAPKLYTLESNTSLYLNLVLWISRPGIFKVRHTPCKYVEAERAGSLSAWTPPHCSKMCTVIILCGIFVSEVNWLSNSVSAGYEGPVCEIYGVLLSEYGRNGTQYSTHSWDLGQNHSLSGFWLLLLSYAGKYIWKDQSFGC